MHQRRANPTAPHAFTLVEIVLALSVLGIVLAALGSVLGLTLRALPGRGEASEQPALAARALELLSDDITTAEQIASSSTTLALVIPDRNADGVDERVEYQWDGVRGSPLQRRLNGGSWSNILDRINGLAITTDRFTSLVEVSSTPVEGSEQMLSAWETGAAATYSLSTTVWAAQNIVPILPGDAISWRPTRIEVNARNVTPIDGVVVIDVRSLATDGTPGTTSLGTATLNESVMTSSYAWYSVTLPSIAAQPPTTGLSMVFRTNGSGVVAGRLQGATSGIAGAGGLYTSANGGTSWSGMSDGAVYHRLWGAVTRNVTTTAAMTRVRDVAITLTPTDNKPITTRVLTPAMPEAR